MKRTKKLLNGQEAKTRTILNEIASRNGAEIFPKQRVADVLEISQSGLSREDYSYALKAHFDFVVAEANFEPLFAVEFDGPHHQSGSTQAENDERKDRICRFFNFPILRISAAFLTKEVRQFNLLSWLVDLWFTERDFDRAQEAGQVPYDEPFMYFNILSIGGNEVTWPYDLTRPLRALIQDAHERRLIKDFCPSVYVAEGANKIVSGVALLQVNDERTIIGKAECRSYQFSPVSPYELCEELAIIEVGEKLKTYLKKPYSTFGIELEKARQEVALIERLGEEGGYIWRHG